MTRADPTIATRRSWHLAEPPAARQALGLVGDYDFETFAAIKLGFIPDGMDDRWFIYFEDGWLYLHRSWTGQCIFGIRLEETASGVRIVESWASRDLEHYSFTSVENDEWLARSVIENVLLAPRLDVRSPFRVTPG